MAQSNTDNLSTDLTAVANELLHIQNEPIMDVGTTTQLQQILQQIQDGQRQLLQEMQDFRKLVSTNIARHVYFFCYPIYLECEHFNNMWNSENNAHIRLYNCDIEDNETPFEPLVDVNCQVIPNFPRYIDEIRAVDGKLYCPPIPCSLCFLFAKVGD